MYTAIRKIIEAAWENRELLKKEETRSAIDQVIGLLDKGKLRTATPTDEGWQVNEWVKKAVILYFPTQPMSTMTTGPFEYHDKIRLKQDYAELGVRVVPPAAARYGAYVAPGVVMMPSYVQIGKNVHLSGGVGIGGVLEPVQAAPVIIEDNCFIGSRCIIVEGAHLEEEVVLGANTVITASTRIIDVTGNEPIEYQGYVPARSVVIPGSRKKQFPAGEYEVPCALIIGKRKASTDLKTSLNSALREFDVPV